VASAACYSLGISYQAREARRVGLEHSLRLSLLRRLVRRRGWVLGISIDGCGWILQAAALALVPLTLVQPALAVGLVFLLVLGARMLEEPVGRAEVVAVLAIAAGVAGLASVAPAHATDHAARGPLVVAFGVLATAAVVPYLVARLTGRRLVLLAACAGLAFACDGLAMKLMTDDVANGAWLGSSLWLAAMGAFAGLGTLCELSALQTSPVTSVAPVVFLLDTLIPFALAPILAGESWSSGPAVVVSATVVLLGGAALARSRPVEALITGPPPSPRSAPPRSALRPLGPPFRRPARP
jgi:hypothetical protein